MLVHRDAHDCLDTPFARAVRDFDALGFNLIPSAPNGKRPARGLTWKEHHSPDSPRLSAPSELQLYDGEVSD